MPGMGGMGGMPGVAGMSVKIRSTAPFEVCGYLSDFLARWNGWFPLRFWWPRPWSAVSFGDVEAWAAWVAWAWERVQAKAGRGLELMD